MKTLKREVDIEARQKDGTLAIGGCLETLNIEVNIDARQIGGTLAIGGCLETLHREVDIEARTQVSDNSTFFFY